MTDDAPKKIKAPRISAKVKQAIDALVLGHEATVTGAAERAGISREYLSRQVNRPEVAAYLDQRLKQNLALGRARAGAVKLALLDSTNEMVRHHTSSWFLGSNGGGEASFGGDKATPGVVIQIVQPPAAPALVNVTPPQIVSGFIEQPEKVEG